MPNLKGLSFRVSLASCWSCQTITRCRPANHLCIQVVEERVINGAPLVVFYDFYSSWRVEGNLKHCNLHLTSKFCNWFIHFFLLILSFQSFGNLRQAKLILLQEKTFHEHLYSSPYLQIFSVKRHQTHQKGNSCPPVDHLEAIQIQGCHFLKDPGLEMKIIMFSWLKKG